MTAVFKHELKSYFHSFPTYLFCAFLLVLVGVGALLYNIQSAVANFELVLQLVSLGLVVLVPILTMRSIAEEKKQKTDQLLYSLPLKGGQIVLGKYFALLAVFLLPMIIVCIYPLIFAKFGEVYLPTSYGSIIAFYFMGAALIAIGLFLSSLTENIGVAAGISIAFMLLNYYLVPLAEYVSKTAMGSLIAVFVIILLFGILMEHLTKSAILSYGIAFIIAIAAAIAYRTDNAIFEGLLPNVMSKISLFDRFNDFVNGVFDLTSIVFYVTVAAFFLFAAVQSLEKRRYN